MSPTIPASIFKTFIHCPRCGGRLAWKSGGPHEPRRQTCRRCRYQVFHNPVGATEMYFVRAGRVLLLRRARPPRLGYWDLPGGFMENGEEPLVALRREISEELGGKIIRPKLFGAYATGYKFQNELTSVVVLAYRGELRGPIRLNHENSEAAWVSIRHAHRLSFTHQQKALRDLAKVLRTEGEIV